MPADALLERDDILDELTAALREATRAGGRMVLLAGSAGVGKTAVVRALGERAAGGVRQLHGSCDALGTPRALDPLLDMLEQSPRLASAAGGTRHALFSALMRELTSAQTLVVIEDAHWADAATADLLVHLGRRVAGTKSLVIVTYRDEELRPEHPVRIAFDGMATERALVRRVLQPLSLGGVTALAAGREIDVPQLHARTGGNPFFVTEVLAAPGWAVPPTVADAVRARAHRLPSGARAVLDTMAVEAGSVRLGHLLRLGHAPDDVDAAVASGMLVHADRRLTFRHELARLGILGDLAPAARAARHRAWLTLLQPLVTQNAHAARLAAHAIGADDPAATVAWSRRAAEHAAARGTHREAAAHLEAAVAAGDALEPHERAHLLSALMRELMLIDRRADAVRAGEEALRLYRGLGDRAAALIAQADLAKATWGLGEGPAARRLIADALAELAQLHTHDGEAARAVAYVNAWAGYLAMLARNHVAATRHTTQAVEFARSYGLDDILIVALNALGSTMIVGARDLAGVTLLQESRDLADATGNESAVGDALANLGSALGEIRAYEPAARYLEEGVAFTTARDLDATAHYVTAWLARVRFEQGAWPEAAALASGVELAATVSPESAIVAVTVRGRIAARQGEPAGEPLDEAWRLAVDTDDLQRLWPVAAARAELAWLTGADVDAAMEEVERIRARADELDVTWARDELTFWRARIGRAAATPADAAAADDATPFALQLAGAHSAAASAWAVLGCPYERAWALADVGDEPSLREALALLQELGAAPLAARVRQQLRNLGATDVPLGKRAAATTHPSGLTDRQLAVLELVAVGLTDRQIAERLSLSAKTVGHHVSAILERLDVESRTAAARVAVERGWVAKMGSLPHVEAPRAP